MNLEPIVTLLEESECGRAGRTIFINEMPAECRQGILLLDNYHGTPIDHYLPGYYATEYRLIVRSTEQAAGRALCQKALSALTVHGDRTVDDTTIKQMLPITLPRPYRRSVGGYWEFEVDIAIRFVA